VCEAFLAVVFDVSEATVEPDEPAEAVAPVVEVAEADASEFTLVLAVVLADALAPELVDALFALRVLLQLASSIASGNTKNTFFITWSFCYQPPRQNDAKFSIFDSFFRNRNKIRAYSTLFTSSFIFSNEME
jgi:hypothetical protein